jgi:hypothetical protein
VEAPKVQAHSKKRYLRRLMRDFGHKLVRGIKPCSDQQAVIFACGVAQTLPATERM